MIKQWATTQPLSPASEVPKELRTLSFAPLWERPVTQEVGKTLTRILVSFIAYKWSCEETWEMAVERYQITCEGAHTCILLLSQSYMVLSVLDMWSPFEILGFLGIPGPPLWQGWSEFPAWRSTWCCAVTKQRSRRYDLMDGPKVIAQLGHSQLKRTDEWNMLLKYEETN